MEIYLDNSATTKPYPGVTEKVAAVMDGVYGNPSSLHRIGIAAEKELRQARERLAYALKANVGEIYFTSGGTESDNLAIAGVCRASRGKHIISSPIEHPAVMNTLAQLESEGCTVEYLPVDENGVVDLATLEEMVRPDTALVTVMLVNNEIGTVQPIEKIAKLIKRKNPNTCLHTDAVQGFGKVPCHAGLGADLISVSSHKIHGPKGVGALYVRRGVRLSPILYGGGQQNGIRSGTENVPGYAGFGLAAKLCVGNMEASCRTMTHLREKLCKAVTETVERVQVNTPTVCAPHILNLSFDGVRSEVLLHSLEAEGIYVSSGSACSSHKKAPSYVLTEIGADKARIDGSIRLSLSEFTTEEEINQTAAALGRIVPQLRRLKL